ncbi:dual specificity kinase shkC-like [Paramuricea clavata]|nr:dual specificity kinase shkC-like [Paramuricea clavata]
MGKTRNINYGWLHRTSSDNAYKQLKRLEGASVRTVPYDEEETYFTLDFLKNEACRLFFPEDFEIEIGSFSQEPILAFVDTRGNPCSYLEYLRDRGLYPSKSYIYLMTTARGDKNTGTRDNISSEPKATKQHTDMDDENESEADATNSKHVARRLQNSESNEAECEIKDPVKKDDLVKDGNIYGVCIDGIDVTPSKNQITIEYEELTEFSYSEVTIRSLANSLEQCYWDKSLSDPFIRNEGFDNFCPLEHGFTVTAIHKADTCYLERVFSPSCESFEESTSRFFYPCRDNSSNDIIIHHPLEIWGYDENRLMLGVVTSFMDNPEVEYVWYNGGDIARQGHNLCCIPVNEPGIYKVEVRVDGKAEMSKPIKVELLKNLEDPPTDEKKKNAEPEASIKSPHFLPFVDKNQVTFTNEIGRGSYGVVFKGVWSGTDVAIKDIKVRNAKRLKSVMETEVQVHTMVRHPNITQIMAVSMEKNHLYIVSEFVNGANLEELLFGEDVEVKENISEKKIFIAKQVTQAAAYLHNLSPPIVHRDIKPANIVVAKDSYVTKLCDMGLSKLKSATMQAVTATGVPGTPHYMAPECILRKKKSDLNSDV